jgi:hypothetical protein
MAPSAESKALRTWRQKRRKRRRKTPLTARRSECSGRTGNGLGFPRLLWWPFIVAIFTSGVEGTVVSIACRNTSSYLDRLGNAVVTDLWSMGRK